MSSDLSSKNIVHLYNSLSAEGEASEVHTNAADYEAALRLAGEESRRLMARIAGDQKRISELRVLMAGLRNVLGLPTIMSGYEPRLGVTAIIRDVLNPAESELFPCEIRDRVIRLGIEIGDYTNLLASIHSCLVRLVDSGEVQRLTLERGRKKYKRNAG